MKIILASSSTYRKKLLQNLIPNIDCISPDIDESGVTGEQPDALAKRLAIEKARMVSEKIGQAALVIGSDQVAWLHGEQLKKPGNRAQNITQLEKCSGQTVTFYTGICLLNSATQKYQASVERYETTFRKLSREQIERYVDKEQAFDCAGGFKMESLGISLFRHIRGDDPNSLIGLPLIKLVDFLNNEGIDIP